MKGVSRGPVERAIRQVARQVKATVSAINQRASKCLAKGNYAAAEELVKLARAVGEFDRHVEELRLSWVSVARAGDGKGPRKDERTPQWAYYHPILQSLAALGGRANTKDLLRHLEGTIQATLKSGDISTTTRGSTRWKVMVQRARAAMLKEGLLERERGKGWKISAAGRKAADSPTMAEQ